MLIASQYGMRSGSVTNRGGVGATQTQSPQTQFSADTSTGNASASFQPLRFTSLDTANATGNDTGSKAGSGSDSAQTATAGSAPRTSGGIRLGSIIDILV